STAAEVTTSDMPEYNLYYTIRYGFGPAKIVCLAQAALDAAAQGAWPPHHPLRLRPGKERVPGSGRLGRRGQGRLAAALSGSRTQGLRSWRHQALDEGVLRALLHHQSVQALGRAQRAQDRLGRLAVAARRL